MLKRNNQIIPILLAVIVFFVVTGLYFSYINILNLFPGEKIYTNILLQDVLVGLTIYLKTSVDFALLIGILMKQFPGMKNRIAIESGTAIGNVAGTVAILTVWYFFKEITWLLALMVFVASLVLFKLAQTSIEHVHESTESVDKDLINQDIGNSRKSLMPSWLDKSTQILEAILRPINKLTAPILSKITPDLSFKSTSTQGFLLLVIASFTIPFILGLDDFAGYVPLFNVVNVFGFGVGVFLGHTILNILLFINPNKTIQIVKNPIISIIGTVVFIGLACWGLYEVVNILNAGYLHIGGVYHD